MKPTIPKIILTLFIFFLFPLISSAFLSFPNQIDTKQERMNVQTVLNEVMNLSPNLVVDGILGRKSIQAVQAFQEVNGLVADGKIGPITRSQLEKAQTNSSSSNSECAPGALFSIITGKLCSIITSTLPAGCTSTTLFSPLTGQSCTKVTLPTQVVTSIIPTILPVISGGSSGGGRGGGGGSSNPPVCSGSTTQSCSITNGTGSQSRTCNSGVWSSYGTCTFVSCNSGYQISGNSCVVIPDTTKPVVTVFTIPTTSSSLTVSITTFTATDAVGVTGYLLAETSTTPSASSGSWTSSPPTTYTFTSVGSKTLYTWAKDSAGNVSTSISRSVTITLPSTGNTYYISPSGSDTTGNGSISDPWFTLNKAWIVIAPGDTVYLRGGTYRFSSQQYLIGKDGTAVNTIKIFAYPGETPIISRQLPWTFTNMVSGIYFDGDYFHWKGIHISGFTQQDDGYYGQMWTGFVAQYANHNLFEQLVVSYNGAGMDISHGSNDNLVLNSDFHHNYDPYTVRDPYGNADGFMMITDVGTTNTVRGCRSWLNSDDGYDSYGSSGFILIDNSWAWMNGYREDGIIKGGDGNGIKLGGTFVGEETPTTHLRTVTNSLAFHNRAAGFDQNAGKFVSWLFNNTAYHNADGPTNADGSDVYKLNFQFQETVIVHVLRNNIAYANQHPTNLQANYANSINSNNTWNGGVTVTDADFLSVDSTGVDGPRQSDGSLPNLNFLKLAQGSDLINAGTDVGLSYNGSAPDIGAFESSSVLGTFTYNFTLTLKYSSSGNEVKELQKILISNGYLTGTPDGIYGILTLNAVKEYQKANGLTPDGIIGPSTREILSR